MRSTCVEFPPVDFTEKRMRPDLIAAPVLEAHPLVHLPGQQPLTQWFGVLAEALWVDHHPGQHALLHLLTFNLRRKGWRRHPQRFSAPSWSSDKEEDNWPFPLGFWTGSLQPGTQRASLPEWSSPRNSRTSLPWASLEACILRAAVWMSTGGLEPTQPTTNKPTISHVSDLPGVPAYPLVIVFPSFSSTARPRSDMRTFPAQKHKSIFSSFFTTSWWLRMMAKRLLPSLSNSTFSGLRSL